MGLTSPAEADPARPVEVMNRFDGRWCSGYDIAEVDLGDDGPRYRVRRASDGSLIPTWFEATELRQSNVGYAVEWQLSS